MSNITQFTITNLYGYKNFDLKLKNNTLILVGENGSGKTTVLRLFYYFVTAQWNLLKAYQFDELTVVIDGKKFVLAHSELGKKIDNRFLKTLPHFIRNEIEETLLNEDWPSSISKLEIIADKYRIPLHYILNEIDEENQITMNKKIRKVSEDLTLALNMKFLYLPTFRRIEQELKT